MESTESKMVIRNTKLLSNYLDKLSYEEYFTKNTQNKPEN